jgi:hypothetical protein
LDIILLNAYMTDWREEATGKKIKRSVSSPNTQMNIQQNLTSLQRAIFDIPV